MSSRACRLAFLSAALFFIITPPVHSQGLAGRVALEAIAAANTDARSLDDPTVILDLVSTVRVGDGWDLVLRPWSLRRPGGDWTFEMYQAEVRYVSSTKVPFRVDAGIISSPLGLATLELQPHANPLIGSPFYYLTPLPAVDGRAEGVRLMSGGYPLGAMFSVSGEHWDARAGVTDTTVARQRWVFNDAKYDASPQLVFGGGISPKAGFRVGAGFARGQYRSRLTVPSGASIEPQDATIFNLEAEYAAGHTRASGEWIRDRFERPSGAAVARGFNVQVVHTLTPRIFAAARATRASSPVLTTPVEVRRTATEFQATLGYRLNTEITLRGGYQRARSFNASRWTNAAVMSLVWAERWW